MFPIKSIIITIIIILLLSPSSFSQSVPDRINFQGVLKDGAGNIVPNGDYSLTFKIYNAESGGTALWSETKTLTITDGIFSTQLGSVTPINLTFEEAYWLGISVGSNPEMLPRTSFASVPYSRISLTVPDNSITSAKISAGQVVKSINGLTDNVNLVAGSNITITPSGNDLTISSTGGSGGGGTVTQVNTGAGLTGGPITTTGTISIANDGITSAMIQNNSVTSTKIADGTISTADLSDNSITSAKISDGTIAATDIANTQVVKSINSLKDNVNLVAGSNITITPSGNDLTISATGGSSGIGGSGITDYIPLFNSSSTLTTSNIFQNSGNLGIGTTTPEGLLHIKRYGDKQLILGHNNQPNFEWIFDIDGAAKMKLLNEHNGTPIALMTFNPNNGSVGIGDLFYPNSKLDVLGGNWDLNSTEGDFRIGNDLYRLKMGVATSGSGNGDAYIASFGGTNRLFLGTGNNSNSITTLTLNNNKVGIGTITPNYRLHVESNEDVAGYFTSNTITVNTTVLKSVVTGNSYTDATAVYGSSIPQLGYGIGGIFEGGYFGVRGIGIGSTSVGGSVGVYGYAFGGTVNYAGYFEGNVLVSGTLSKAGGSFKIDHPLDPQNKYLYHSFVESPDMMNIYNGNILTDASGFATVTLPDWFEALNKDFRYQLTVIGEFAQAIITQKIQNNQFVIRTDKPNVEVSWQVTGIRQDKFAEKNRIPVEEYKQGEDVGKYLHPDAFGLPETMGINYKLRTTENQRQK